MGVHEDKYNKGLVVLLDWHKADGLFRPATKAAIRRDLMLCVVKYLLRRDCCRGLDIN